MAPHVEPASFAAPAAAPAIRDVSPPLPNESQILLLAERSAIIFAGKVVNVEQIPEQNGAAVTFLVSSAVRGTQPGIFQAKFIEPALAEIPLQVNEQVVVFLRARNAAGYTSFVSGACGIVERTGADQVSLDRFRLCPGATPPPIPHEAAAPISLFPKPLLPIARGATPPIHATGLQTDAKSSSVATADLLRLLTQKTPLDQSPRPDPQTIADPPQSLPRVE